MSAIERFVTGVDGLDAILRGGLARGGVYLVEGPAGVGKTILANQVAFHHASRGSTALYVTLLAETHARMVLHMRDMSFFDAALLPANVRYLSAFKPLEDEGLSGLLTLLRRSLVEHTPTLLVIDGLGSAEEVAQSHLPSVARADSSSLREVIGISQFKLFLNELQTIAGMTGCTVLMLSSAEQPLRYRPAHTMVDGIIDLSFDATDLRPVRHVQITKIRGVAQEVGRHVYTIDENGIHVYPRFETQVPDKRELVTQSHGATQPIAFGLPGLDEMIPEGLPSGSMTMLL
ncbi:MAG TPA: ATPase domain-containing protein, partial [Nannocystaceae bacterium]|nr:ATPase domain-containing protein [Nannocystaceae bacterium]